MLPKVKVLHLEPTEACNAACPQCSRETDPKFNKTSPTSLSLSDIKGMFSVDFIKDLDKMFMCGNYGDPAACSEAVDILRYFRELNPKICLGFHSNGGLRNEKWWQELAEVLNQPYDYVVFSIDGLESTNHIYRVNVSWPKLMSNAKSFIAAGGKAHWDMLMYEHNEHQIFAAQELARQLGFKWFRVKITKRFGTRPISFLNKPSKFKEQVFEYPKIVCHVEKENSIYVSAKGVVYPCCWLGDANGPTLDKFDTVKQSWGTTNPHSVCSATCTADAEGSKFTKQWKLEVELQ